jgi:hypothetical protein
MRKRLIRWLIGAVLALALGWAMSNTHPPVAYGEGPTPTPTPVQPNDPGGSSGGGH